MPLAFFCKLLTLTVVLLQVGCVTGTRSIELEVPAQPTVSAASGTVFIGEIVDNRVFEQKPAQASTPSVAGNLAETNAEQRSRLIGRQRNGYGKAMGDVALAGDSTVQQEVRKLLVEGFSARGYEISETPDSDVQIHVSIEKFWGWFRPGFVKIGFESDVDCALEVDSAGRKQSISVAGKGLNNGQVASDANWQLSFKRAYADFLNNLGSALEQAGL